jgi:hypothetical protein
MKRKIYTRLVIDIGSQKVVAADSFDYSGRVAELKGGSKTPKREDSMSGIIVGDLYRRGPLRGALENVLSSPGDDPFTQRQADLLTQRVRGGYGARGLAGSGISVQGEQDTLRDFLAQRGEAKQNQAIAVLGTGGTAPQFPQKQQGTGFLGLK